MNKEPGHKAEIMYEVECVAGSEDTGEKDTPPYKIITNTAFHLIPAEVDRLLKASGRTDGRIISITRVFLTASSVRICPVKVTFI